MAGVVEVPVEVTQVYVAAPDAVSVALLPEQMLPLLEVVINPVNTCTRTGTDTVATQPAECVPVTTKVVPVEGAVVNVDTVLPVFQE